MRISQFKIGQFRIGELKVGVSALGLVTVAALLLPACSVNVQKEKNGQDKKVDISTPLGGIHVSKDADLQDVGIALYPGARPSQEDSSGDDKNANVNISGFGYGVRVVALKYESDDSPQKLVTFYKDQLKKYGNVLECHTSGHLDLDVKMGDGDSRRVVTCIGEKGNNVELRVGARDNQHVVEVEPQGQGSSFSLVYVRTHGKDADI